jgi:hypothetical protein
VFSHVGLYKDCVPANFGPILLKLDVWGSILERNVMLHFNFKSHSWICASILDISCICTHVLGWSMWIFSSVCVIDMISAGCSYLADCGFYSLQCEWDNVNLDTCDECGENGNSIATLTDVRSNNIRLMWHRSKHFGIKFEYILIRKCETKRRLEQNNMKTLGS